MYFTSGSDRAFEQLMQTRPGADHFDSGEAGAPEDCGTCRFYRPHWKYQFCVYGECPYQPGKLTALDGAVKFQVKGVDDEMAVFRVEKNRGYTVMSNHHLRNKDLSLKAKGLLSQMLSLPEDWDFTLKGLSLINREQIDAIRAAVRELEQAGYIVRSRERDSQGRLRGADYIIYEQPQPVPDSPTLENPTLENPTQEKPTQEKPTQLNKDRSSKEKSITDGSNTDSIPILSPPSPLGEEAAAPPERKGTGAKSQSAVEIYREIIKDNIEYERMFQITFLVLNTADTRQKLENDVFWAAGIAQKYNCSLVRLDYQQEQGLMSSLPLGASHIQIERSLTTSSVAVFVPFVTQELFQGGDAMYYGINAKTGNMIMLDRKRARCPNGLKLGTPGSGKSMSCKSEIVSVFLCTPDDVYICDPEAEYYPLVKRLHGQVVKLSPTSKNYVNPLDINLNYSEDENPLALKSDFVLSFCELVMGGKNGLEAIEKTVIDRAVQVIYRPYLADPKPENMPILADLHKALLDQHIPEADRVAQALDLYVSGSLNVFNHRTNIDIQNRIVAFDIKELGKQLKKIGMLIVQDQIWGRVTKNRSKGKATWYFCDEFHLLLREEQTAAFSCEIWKRFRKWGGIPTGATQNVKDLLSSPEIENILENSDFICLLNQASGDRKILAERLNISPQQLRYVDNSEPGEGLLIYENVILPFKNPIPKNTQLYQIMTTRLGEGATV